MNIIEAATREIERLHWPMCLKCERRLELDHLRCGGKGRMPDIARLYCPECGVEREVELMLERDQREKFGEGMIVYNPRGTR